MSSRYWKMSQHSGSAFQTEEDDKTSPPMVAVMAAGLPVLGCCESNVGKN